MKFKQVSITLRVMPFAARKRDTEDTDTEKAVPSKVWTRATKSEISSRYTSGHCSTVYNTAARNQDSVSGCLRGCSTSPGHNLRPQAPPHRPKSESGCDATCARSPQHVPRSARPANVGPRPDDELQSSSSKEKRCQQHSLDVGGHTRQL